MEIRLRRKLRRAAIWLVLCALFTGLLMMGGCSGTVVCIGGNVTQQVADSEATASADSAQFEQTDGGTSLGNPSEPTEPEVAEPSEPQVTSDE